MNKWQSKLKELEYRFCRFCNLFEQELHSVVNSISDRLAKQLVAMLVVTYLLAVVVTGFVWGGYALAVVLSLPSVIFFLPFVLLLLVAALFAIGHGALNCADRIASWWRK